MYGKSKLRLSVFKLVWILFTASHWSYFILQWGKNRKLNSYHIDIQFIYFTDSLNLQVAEKFASMKKIWK